jgi:O-antigen/teichoic acid export membrane protein
LYSRIRHAVTQQFANLKKEGSFSRNFAFTFSGNMVSLVLQVALSPVLARIYSPEAYGLFAVFNSLTLNYSLVSSLSYTNAILVTSKKNTVYSLIALSAFISFATCVFALLLFYFFEKNIINLFNIQAMSGWVYLIPVSSLLLNWNIILSSYNIFHSRIKEDTAIVTATNILNRIFNLSFGLLIKGNFMGLLIGDLLTKVIRLGLLFRGISVIAWRRLRVFLYKKTMVRVAKEFSNYPFFVFPSMLLNAASMHLPIFLFSIYFSVTEVGYFSFASTLLYIPIQIFGNSAASIFLKKASDIHHSDGIEGLKAITQKLYWNFFSFGLVGFSFLMMFGDVLFSFVFGERWAIAGEYSIHLAAYHIFLLIFTPLNSVFSILRKEKLLLSVYAIVFLLRITSLYWGIYYKDALLTVKVFSWVNGFAFLFLCLFILKIVKASFWKHFLFTILSLTVVLILVYFVRSFTFN